MKLSKITSDFLSRITLARIHQLMVDWDELDNSAKKERMEMCLRWLLQIKKEIKRNESNTKV